MKSCFAQAAEGFTDDPFAASCTTTIRHSEKDEALCTRFEKLIEDDFSVQKMAVRGHDKENRPIIVRSSRGSKWSGDEAADEGFRWAQVYIAERAIAATELQSMGKNEKLTAFFDFSSYSAHNAPPVKVMVDTVKVLQANYPERLGKAVVLDAPFWMQAIMNIVTPFLAIKTRDKLVVLGISPLPSLWPVKGSSYAEVREQTVRAVVDLEHAMPFMLPDGKLASTIDVDRQLRQVPFYELYDSVSPPDDTVAAES